VGEGGVKHRTDFRVLFVKVMPRYLGPISFVGGGILVCVLVRRHAVVVRLVVVLAVTAVPDCHVLQDEFNIIWNEGAQGGKVISVLHFSISYMLE